VTRGRDVVSVDGRLVPAARATISVFDRGFLYGDAVFETVRAYGGRLLLWRAHERRLLASLRAFGIARPALDLRRATLEVVAARRLRDAAVRVTVTRGRGEGLVAPRGLAPTVVIAAREVPADLSEQRGRGASAVLLPFGHGRGGLTDGHKTTAYLSAVVGKSRAAARGALEGVYVERDGTVSEGTTSNLFVVRRGALTTAPLHDGCLPGVTRSAVLRLAAQAALEVRVRPLPVRELHAADEMFLTASTLEVMPLVRLDGRPVGDGRPGPVTRLLQERYARFVRRALARS
jgi:branched-subunit amino acid aminotransferase/4-amino-4-deoxychorismate lyase